MKITISGGPGSGQSTLAILLAQRLGYTHQSAGTTFRKFTKTYSYSLADLQSISISNQTADLHVDETTKKFGRDNDNFVYEGLLAWHFIPSAVKVFVHCEMPVRMWRHAMAAKISVRDAERSIRETEDYVIKRFRRLYGISEWSHARNFDLLVDSSRTSPELLCDEIIRFLERRDPIARD